MTSAEIRLSFLQFFSDHGHEIVSSSSLVPTDDPTLLFTNAGMNQFKDVFLGKDRRAYKRATSSQKCMRVSGKHNDLNNVGPSLRHHTFFEMLGNFSFGDYFKADAIPLAWTLLTETWGIPKDRLYPTIFEGTSEIPRDDEAHATWAKLVPTNRILELGLAENFWAMGDTGPCGRCSEIHFHRGDQHPCTEPVCRGIDCSCDRYVEIWNNVFMEFERHENGSFINLPAPSIDTGMGLERITAVLQDTLSNYDTDLFLPLLDAIGDITDSAYDPDAESGTAAATAVSMRVVADHLRAMTFLIADGVLPSNEWRGYVLRKIMRRAMRHGKKLGMTEPFLHRLVDGVVNEMDLAYPKLGTARDTVAEIVRREEDRFDAVLNDGLPRLEAVLRQAQQADGVINGGDVFRLYDTYGLPLDFIEDIANERQLQLDRSGFDAAMERQRKQSRSSQTFESLANGDFSYAKEETSRSLRMVDDRFEGYKSVQVKNVPILALFDDSRHQVSELGEGERGYAALERTPFYIEAGGQVSDTGRLIGKTSQAAVDAMGRLGSSGPRLHAIQVTSGHLRDGDRVSAEVDRSLRDATRRNHTATHLLHAALRTVLGEHVKQAGSLVAPDRLRFDITHFEPITAAQLTDVEKRVNQEVYANNTVQTEVRATNEAIAEGAMALFGEKYGDNVRVVSIRAVSMELCGGTHCRATGDIGPFVITQESGIAAGVRRIEALTGDAAVTYISARRQTLDGLLDVLAVPADQAVDTVQKLQGETKRLGRELEQLKVKAAMGNIGADEADETVDVSGVTLMVKRVCGLDKVALRALSDSLRGRLGSGVVVLVSDTDGKVSLLVSVTKDLVERIHAGHLIKALAPIIGGRGGGRRDFAEAGGRLPHKIDDVFPESRAILSRMLEPQS